MFHNPKSAKGVNHFRIIQLTPPNKSTLSCPIHIIIIKHLIDNPSPQHHISHLSCWLDHILTDRPRTEPRKKHNTWCPEKMTTIKSASIGAQNSSVRDSDPVPRHPHGPEKTNKHWKPNQKSHNKTYTSEWYRFLNLYNIVGGMEHTAMMQMCLQDSICCSCCWFGSSGTVLATYAL